MTVDTAYKSGKSEHDENFLRLYRRGKSGQHRASRFLTGRGLGVNTRIMESAAESIPPMAFKHR